MSKQFPEVQAEDFSKITAEKLPHQLIEIALIEIGGGGVSGTEFKTQAIRAAGWSAQRLATYSGKPDKAAAAFNRVREVLADTREMGQVMQRLKAG